MSSLAVRTASEPGNAGQDKSSTVNENTCSVRGDAQLYGGGQVGRWGPNTKAFSAWSRRARRSPAAAVHHIRAQSVSMPSCAWSAGPKFGACARWRAPKVDVFGQFGVM
jgi:hypothetical protein